MQSLLLPGAGLFMGQSTVGKFYQSTFYSCTPSQATGVRQLSDSSEAKVVVCDIFEPGMDLNARNVNG